MSAEVTTLASTIRGTVPLAPGPAVEQQQADANMDTVEKRDGKMVEEAEAQQAGSLGLATEDASKA